MLTPLGARSDDGAHRPLAIPLRCQSREGVLFLASAHLSRVPNAFLIFRSSGNTSVGFVEAKTHLVRSRDPDILFESNQSAVPRIRFAKENAVPLELPECPFRELSGGILLRSNHPDLESESVERYSTERLRAFAAPSILPWDEP